MQQEFGIGVGGDDDIAGGDFDQEARDLSDLYANDNVARDLLQAQDAITTHLAHAIGFQLTEAEGAHLKRTPAANRDAEDLPLQCDAGTLKAGYIGKEADAAYALCEQALAIDPNNVPALRLLGLKFFAPAQSGVSGDPKGDLERADELESKPEE